MSKLKSLQELARQANLPFTDSLTLHYLRLYARGRLNNSHGAAIKHLQQVGALDKNRQFTPRAQRTLKGIYDASDKKAAASKANRKAKRKQSAQEGEPADSTSPSADGSDSPA